MIEMIQLHGLLSEDHVVHLKKFVRLINTVKSPANVTKYI